MSVEAVSGPSQMQSASMSQAKDIAVLKKSIDLEKDMASQLIEAIPKVDHDAPPGQQVNMMA